MDYKAERDFEDAVTAYATHRAAQLLSQNHFHVDEMVDSITRHLEASVKKGVSEYTQIKLATGHLLLDTHMRLATKTK